MKTPLAARLSSVAAVTLAILSPLAASATEPCQRACSCDHYAGRIPSAYQDYGVPPNARIFVPLANEGGFSILLHPESDPSATIPVAVEEIADAHAAWVTPKSELATDTAFVIEVKWDK